MIDLFDQPDEPPTRDEPEIEAVPELRVSYELYGCPSEDTYDAIIEKAVGRESDGSGSGFGMRDMDWSYEDMDEAEQAAERVRTLEKQIPGMTVGVFDPEES